MPFKKNLLIFIYTYVIFLLPVYQHITSLFHPQKDILVGISYYPPLTDPIFLIIRNEI